MTTNDLSPLLADPRLTTVGLLLETNAGLRAAFAPPLDRHGLTHSAFEVLVRLARSPGTRLRMTELADQATLSNSGLTRVIDRMLQGGLVERVRDDQDKRVFYAALTPLGLDRALSALPSHLAVIDEAITEVLDHEELAALERARRKIRAVVKPEADPDRASQEQSVSA